MGPARVAVLGGLLLFLQLSAEVRTEETPCVAGFEADELLFRVARKNLNKGFRLGRVGFTHCSNHSRFLFRTEDSRFALTTDGILKVNRPVVLHDGHIDFSIHTVGLGPRYTVRVRVAHHGHGHRGRHGESHDGGHQGDHHGGHQGEHHGGPQGDHHGGPQGDHHRGPQGDHHRGHQGDHHGGHQGDHHGAHHGHNGHRHQQAEHRHGDHQHHRLQHHADQTLHSNHSQSSTEPGVPVLHFPKSGGGLRRRKRDWVIPDINVAENDRGPYPLKVSQIRSNEDKIKKIYYSITGPGADQPPINLFNMDRDSGNLYLTQPLDREKQAKYAFQAHAVADGSGNAEDPMEIIVNVIDQNDNKPTFNQTTYQGEVAEASPNGFEIMKVVATDLDEPNNANSDIRYRIMSQDPELPNPNLFAINSVTGAIRIQAGGLDREKYPRYTLEVQASDMEGEGLIGMTKVILTVTDSNDNAPQFTQTSYTASVAENKADTLVLKMSVTDKDEPHSPAWNARFRIVDGDPGKLFMVKTGSNKNEGILSTAKPLDFERSAKHTLLVAVENEVPFATLLPTATATVVVTVLDVNEPPVFDPPEKIVSKLENLPVDADVVQYTASDPDIARKQKVMYKIISDPAGWLTVAKDTGLIKVKNMMDRESHFVKDNKYTALIGAYDNDEVPATGTGTLMIQLEDVNDNAPSIEQRSLVICNKEPVAQLLSVTDKDGPGNAAPYTVSLQGSSKSNWTARMNETKTGILLNLATELPSGEYTVVLRVTDNGGESQESTVQAKVCDCKGPDVECQGRVAGVTELPIILGILGGILLLLMLLLLLLLLARRRKGEKKEPLLQDDDVRDNIYYYDEEGGGEDDQDYDLGVLHQGLDNRPEIFRNDVVPNFVPAPQYRPRPANPEEIGNFIDDNLKAADNDPTAPPYDSLLVFDYEGGGSEAGSLSSLNSSSSGDQDYDCLNEWGPRFKKLADMYGGGEDDDML